MRKFLKLIGVIQEVSNKGRNPKLGKGFMTARRLNPYHPISYIVLPVAYLLAMIMFGVVGMWKEVDVENPFKWH